MKWIQLLLFFILSPNVPLFQTDQVAGIDWAIYDETTATKSEKEDPPIDPNVSFDGGHASYSFKPAGSFFPSKSHFSLPPSRFQGVSPFWRPPPSL